MEPVIGLDVSKGCSVFQAFLARHEPYGKTESIVHDEQGFQRLLLRLQELRARTGAEPTIILEATGHYHRGLVAFFRRESIRHMIINPLLSKRSKGLGLRKVKTDAADAWHLADMYYRGDVRPHRTWEESYMELQHVTRQHEFVTALYVQAKLNARALLDQVFPEYEKVFYDLYSITALHVLQSCLQGQDGRVEEIIADYGGPSRSPSWRREKAERVAKALGEWDRERNKSGTNRGAGGHDYACAGV